MVADVVNAGRLYQGAALQPRTTQRALGHVAGLERGLLLPMRSLLDEVAEQQNLSEDDSDRIIDTDWQDGFLSGLQAALLVRDYE